MGINMDIRNEPEYAFLDLDDLDDTERNKIRAILKPSTGVETPKLPWDIGDKEYEPHLEAAEGQEEEITNQWQHYGMPENIAGFEGCGVPTSTMMPAMQPVHTYASHPVMVYSAIPYSNTAGGDTIPYSYVQRNLYGPDAETAMCTEMMMPCTEVMMPAPTPSGRDNERRGGRGRGGNGGGGKRGPYHQGSNMYNEMQQTNNVGSSQHQFNPMVSMGHSSGAVYPAQAHPSAGAPIFVPSQPQGYFTQAPNMYRNNSHYGHNASSYQSGDWQINAAKYQGSQNETTYYPDHQRRPVHKYNETTRVRRDNCPTSTPPFRQASTNNESETSKKNHGKPLIVNNASSSADSRNNSVHNNTNARYSDNKKVAQLSNNHAKIETTEVTANKEERPEITVVKKEIIPTAAIDNNAVPAGVVGKDKTSHEKEVAVPTAEEKIAPVANQTESPPRATVKIAENAEHQNDAKIVPKNTPEEPVVAKIPETPTATLPTRVPASANVTSGQTVTPLPSVTSWANVLKKGPTMDSMRAPTPITKLPVTRPAPILPPPIVESVPPTKAPSQDVPRNETINRNSTDTAPPKAPETPAWAETKPPIEASHPNNLNDPTIVRMGEMLLIYQINKQTVSLLPRGLTNRSNYCYINSILQALLACPPFYNLLMALPPRRNATKNSTTPLIDNMVRFVREFSPLTEGARVHRKDRSQKRGEETAADVHCGIAFEPSYVYTMLKNTSCAGVFSVEGRQEDAEEFLSCLLNGISDEMLELMKSVKADPSDAASDEEEPNVNFNNVEEEWKVMGPKNKGSITRCTEFARTPLSDIFRGQLRSRVLRTGEDATDNVQPFFTLQLDIEKAESVDVALETLVGKDQVEGMMCSKTKQQIEAWKQVTLEELPVILILHLKWFDYKMDGCSKIFKRVRFPIDLKLDSKVLSPNVGKKLVGKQRNYKLFAVTYHDGKEASKGHYVTDAFHVGYNSWVRYDDSSVKGIYENDVLNPTPPRVPYLLYYRRCDTIGNNPSNTPRTR